MFTVFSPFMRSVLSKTFITWRGISISTQQFLYLGRWMLSFMMRWRWLTIYVKLIGFGSSILLFQFLLYIVVIWMLLAFKFFFHFKCSFVKTIRVITNCIMGMLFLHKWRLFKFATRDSKLFVCLSDCGIVWIFFFFGLFIQFRCLGVHCRKIINWVVRFWHHIWGWFKFILWTYRISWISFDH